MAIVKQSARLGWGVLAGVMMGCGFVPSQAGSGGPMGTPTVAVTLPQAESFAVQQTPQSVRRKCTVLCRRARAPSLRRCVRLCLRQFGPGASSAVPGGASLVGPGDGTEPEDGDNGSAALEPENDPPAGQDATTGDSGGGN